jgi:GMP synthase (glutamine-hydrolysing)
MPSQILLVELGTPVAPVLAERGPYRYWFSALCEPFDADVQAWDAQNESHPPDGEWDAILLTGSASSVHEEAPWSVNAGRWAAAQVQRGLPVLGVCYGHQLLAHSLGGRSGPNPAGLDYGVQTVQARQSDLLFTGMEKDFEVLQVHGDTVLELPPGSHSLASSAMTAHEVIAFSPKARGVQFHPEFDDATVRIVLDVRAELLEQRSPGFAAGVRARLHPVPGAPQILHNFLEYLAQIPRR